MQAQDAGEEFDEISNITSVAQIRKRMGEEMVGRSSKKKCLNDPEKTAIHEGPSDNLTIGKEPGEGTAKSSDGKERAGKPTLSGRVPLMPTHLAEAGYQAEKKGV